jgi:predicted nuclease of predicted toxin-antitoxin system
VKVLFDQNVPRNLARYLTGHKVTRSAEMGWQELENGDLLDEAQNNGFEVMVTADRNLTYQQNLKNRRVGLVVLPSGNWPEVKAHIVEVVRAIDEAEPGSFKELKPARLRRLTRPRGSA